MRSRKAILAALLPFLLRPLEAQDVRLPKTVVAGRAFEIGGSGRGKGRLLLVGPQQVLGRDVTLGQQIAIAEGELYSAGHYIAILTSESGSHTAEFDVLPAQTPTSLGLLARPSRLPVNVPNGISGATYVFDAYRNLILDTVSVSFALIGSDGSTQTKTSQTRNGLAWIAMNSAPKESAARFTARVGDVSTSRVISQVPGEPCSISIKVQPVGNRLEIQTAPVHDCNGNTISDGTIITFTESAGGSQSTVDAPLRKGIATATLPARSGAKISAASGSVVGNEIYWSGN